MDPKFFHTTLLCLKKCYESLSQFLFHLIPANFPFQYPLKTSEKNRLKWFNILGALQSGVNKFRNQFANLFVIATLQKK